MNKKLKTTGISLLLVGVVGVGATLAYLSDNTGPLTNKFTFTDKNIDIKLDEVIVDDDNKPTSDRTEIGQSYKKLVPAQIVEKDPTVTVLANSSNCNVFVSVTNPNGDKLKITDLNSEAWQKLETDQTDQTIYYVYKGEKATGIKDANDELGVVPTSDKAQVLEDVFEHVQVGANVQLGTTFDDIVIKAAAVQADSVTDAEATKTALDLLKQ